MHEIGGLLTESGFAISETGAVGTKSLNYIHARPKVGVPANGTA